MTSQLSMLIVDDEPHTSYMLALVFSKAGWNVRTACNGEQGLEFALADPPTLIITDYQMPRMDGLELCQQLHQEPSTRGIPIILLTARSHRVAPSKLMQTSVCALQQKPFSVRELQTRIDEALSQIDDQAA